MHRQNRRGQVDAEAALALQVVALHCAVAKTYQEALVAAC